MTMLKTMMLALFVMFSGMAFATTTGGDEKKECPEGSEAPECQMKKDDGSFY
ncbi:hypothetical protein NF212_05160 [Parasalinivibrio latis]|uniref:hypothetical protein n=1 Tax=Parasalinivibrio latis TaxID=2952610 RepID=UPI0030E25AA7